MSNHRLKFAAAGLLAAGSSPSEAAIIVFDINPDVTLSNQAVWFLPNLTNGVLTTQNSDPYGESPFGNGSFQLSSVGNDLDGATFNFWAQAMDAGGKGTVVGTQLLNGYTYDVYRIRLTALPFGTVISRNNLYMDGGLGVYLYGDINGAVSSFASTTSYVALRRTVGYEQFQYGWLELTGNGSGGVVATRLAFDDTIGGSILAGQTSAVPEASTLGFAGGLFGLVVAAHLRRRKAAQAAAPDSLLKLAAGEFRN